MARAISYYNYYRGLDTSHITDEYVLEAGLLAKSGTAVEFVYSDSPFVIEHIRLGQLRQFLPAETLASIAHRQFLTRELRQRAAREFMAEIDGFDFVLTCENLALSFPLMASLIGLPRSSWRLPRDNVSVSAGLVDDADVRRALIDVSGAEFSCYEYVRRREQIWLAKELLPDFSAALNRPSHDKNAIGS